MKNKTTIGFIGLGIMGLPMALNLLKAGFRVIGYARNPQKCEEFIQSGGEWAQTPQAVGKQVEVLITIVPNSPEVKEVLFGQNGAALGLAKNTLVIDMSTISPVESLIIAEKLETQGVRMLDAPVSGGDIGAKAGTLSIMIGGDKADVQQAMPIFKAMGKQIVHIGDKSAGQACKSCNQMLIAQSLNAVSETLHYAQKIGVDGHKVREALLGGYANSRVLEIHGLKMLEKDYKPGFQAALHLKDMHIVEQACKHYGVESLATQLSQKKIEEVVKQGNGHLDNSAIHSITIEAKGVIK
jgi:2-hydroxy-3-oxopropionate reductase